ncbi:YeeE/YedE family protein [Streptomyces sp. 8L]|uniref:YeeE/YedE family protein n=1 Tax=Streptomyces sp. 8L TaxID=2877242 RepID=UPI001CD78F71|nr:YeeE/YedE family protein [Streptomyces sp. 8L]MCA1217503.1 YeeE/YedE family protein [Streptomyces sp. 8L]
MALATLLSRRDALSAARTAVPAPAAPEAPPVNRVPLVLSLVLLAGLSVWVFAAHGALDGTLLLLGGGLGLTLFHSRFGFTGAWRQLVGVGNGTGLRAHALLLGTTATLFALVIGTGTGLFGARPAPTAGPLGVSLVLGAFLFGVGMQIGGACASGTLFAVGSGQTSIVTTLVGFIIGSTLYTWQYSLVDHLPSFPPFLLSDHVGWAGSWAITLAALALMVLASLAVQRRRNPPPVGAVPTARGALRALRGAWPLWTGAVVLSVLGAGVLLVSGGAWGVTSAFGLWGAKVVQALGGHPQGWSFWRQPGQAATLSGPVLTDKNSLTDIGIMVGAAVAAAAGGAWTLHRRVPWRTALAGLVGGVLLGIGARLASGCNIGAYLAGIASGSASGWVWGAAALAGTWVGLRLRPLFGLTNPKATDSIC